jgi:hypothetical protein
VEVLSQGDTNRTIIGVMGLTLGVPSADLPVLARVPGDNYFSLNDLVIAVRESTGNSTSQQWISDPGEIAREFYFGEYSVQEYRREKTKEAAEE